MPIVKNHCLRLALCCLSIQGLYGQMTPNAPVKDFRVPRFAENGYTDWVLQGGQGIYDSAEQIRVKDMALRVYSGDERMALELSMESPAATLRLDENRAFSNSTIEIAGANFEIAGLGWTWSGTTKEIEVLEYTIVHFAQSIEDSLVPSAADAKVARYTDIESEQLILQTSETEYRFTFTNQVHVVSGELDLRGNKLVVLADAPTGKAGAKPELTAPSELDSVSSIFASDSVVIKQGDRIVRAGEAQFYPREQRAEFSGLPSVTLPGAYLSGAEIRSRAGEVVLTGNAQAGRAQMILSRTGGLGLQGDAGLSAETIVLADSITLRELQQENLFYFEGSVEVLSGAVHLDADRMTITSNKAEASSADASAGEGIPIGEVRSLIAEGQVRIEQTGQVATGDKVIFYPAQERAVLTGNPRLTNGEAIIVGYEMDLKPGAALITAQGEQLVQVTLPPMADLGYAPSGGAPAAGVEQSQPTEVAPATLVAASAARNTQIQSRRLQMIEGPEQTIFHFTGGVQVVGTNLDASCARMDVLTAPQALSELTTEASVSKRLEVRGIEAFESVEIKQGERIATTDTAYILPQEGKVILEGNSVVNDPRGRVSGYRMTLLQGERRAIVETGGSERPRNTMTLPPIKDGAL
ncbi:MAG: lipopolysaccharide export system protein LptA [Lentimonas sp.]|jgi:lipopolysaccharide export system protein LptA